MQSVIAVIFAAGVGDRMEGLSMPKQFLKLRDKPVLAYTLEHFQNNAGVDKIVLVTLEKWLPYCSKMAEGYRFDKLSAIVPGGLTSQESIRIGLEKTKELYGEDAVVLIHDGVRPLIDDETITKCIYSVMQYGSAITVSPQMETIMIGETQDQIHRIINKENCRVARAPQCFYLRDILEAHRRALSDHMASFADSASMMDYYGYPLHSVMGPIDNIKITTMIDFEVFRALMKTRNHPSAFEKIG